MYTSELPDLRALSFDRGEMKKNAIKSTAYLRYRFLHTHTHSHVELSSSKFLNTLRNIYENCEIYTLY